MNKINKIKLALALNKKENLKELINNEEYVIFNTLLNGIQLMSLEDFKSFLLNDVSSVVFKKLILQTELNKLVEVWNSDQLEDEQILNLTNLKDLKSLDEVFEKEDINEFKNKLEIK